MSEEREVEERKVITVPFWYYVLRIIIKPVIVLFLLTIIIVLTIVYKLETLGYFFGIILVSFLPFYVMWKKVLRVLAIIVLECNWKHEIVRPWYFPIKAITYRKVRFKGVVRTLSDGLGHKVIIANRVYFDEKTGQWVIEASWIHGANDLDVMLTKEAFYYIRRVAEDIITKYAKYDLAFPIVVKEHIMKLTMPMKEIAEKIREEEKAVIEGEKK